MRVRKINGSGRYLSMILVVFLVLIVFGYAFISTSVVNNKKDELVWHVTFKNISVVSGSVDAIIPATISSTGTEINYVVDLINSTDYYKFEVDVVNDGNIDAKVDSVFRDSLSYEQQKFIDYEITYIDGSVVNRNDILNVGESERVVVSVKYKDGVNLADLSADISSIDLSFSINYVEAN